MKKKVIFKKAVPKGDDVQVIDFLDSELPLSKSILKEAMIQGSCWLKKGNSKALRRVRRAKSPIRAGDIVEFYYDPMLFERQKEADDLEPQLIKNERDWSAWYKPAGLLSQGTKYGDSLSLLRRIEKQTKNEPFLIHRLDRETDGVMVVAHNAKSAKLLSAKWRGTLVQKIYHAWVLGEVTEEEGRLDEMIDGKKAITYFKVLERLENRTYLELRLGTGRTTRFVNT
jgi:tRNA pseudouridine32 synthase/23S rRNA pseudouridine746 synthase